MRSTVIGTDRLCSGFRRGVVLATLALTAPVAVAGTTFEELELPGGETLHYALVVPENLDHDAAYPVLLALPPGDQSRRMVEAGLTRYWGEQAARHGWIVASPVAPSDASFWGGAEWMIPPLLDHLAASFHVEGGTFHIAGSSNGGRSAFRIAGLHPKRFASMTVLPGFPPTEADDDRLDAILEMNIAMFVGGRDERWLERMATTYAILAERGADVRFTVLPGEGHVPPSLDGDVIMTHLSRVVREVAAVERILNDFHDAASAADGPRYLGHLADDAVFIGTDQTERWTKDAFATFASPYFDRGQGWTYTPGRRHVSLSVNGAVAWFDESLENAKYGSCRGTGVLVRTAAGWKIAQYALTIPIPNPLATRVVEMIRGE